MENGGGGSARGQLVSVRAVGKPRSLNGTLELAHLLAVIEQAAKLLDESLADVDAAILRAHGAELARGREWPGDRITSTAKFG